MTQETDIITEKDILKMVLSLIRFPYAQVCKHHVACELLSLLEGSSYKISNELAKSVVEADDENSIQIISKLLEE